MPWEKEFDVEEWRELAAQMLWHREQPEDTHPCYSCFNRAAPAGSIGGVCSDACEIPRGKSSLSPATFIRESSDVGVERQLLWAISMVHRTFKKHCHALKSSRYSIPPSILRDCQGLPETFSSFNRNPSLSCLETHIHNSLCSKK